MPKEKIDHKIDNYKGCHLFSNKFILISSELKSLLVNVLFYGQVQF
jgi:hypothetical protein